MARFRLARAGALANVQTTPVPTSGAIVVEFRTDVPGTSSIVDHSLGRVEKGRKPHPDGTTSHFHLQITASGLKRPGANSEAELFQKIPDIDTLHLFRNADEDSVVITIRGVGEMQPANPSNHVTLAFDQRDEFQVARAQVAMGDPRAAAQPTDSPQTVNDRELWQAMDDASDQVANILAGPGGFEVIARGRDGIGTTHHESGTLWMGTDPTTSVTTPNARFHHVVNAYVAGPALLPSMGSPNPMLSGIALARRCGEHLVAPSPPPPLETGFQSLFDGTLASFQQWQQVGPGRFDLLAGENVLVAAPGGDIGLLMHPQAFGDFVLRLQFRLDGRGDNSGVFVRFADPSRPLPTDGPRELANPAWRPVATGFEIQIDEAARPDGADKHRTGAIYDVDPGPAPGQQAYRRGSALQPGEWNDLEIEVAANLYIVRLNGYATSRFTNTDPHRGVPVGLDPQSGFIGLQEHTGRVAFRAIRIKG